MHHLCWAMTKLYKRLLIFLLALAGNVSAMEPSKGWNALLAGDFFAAKEQFEAVLQKDSLNQDALEGMMVIHEIFNAPIAYQNTVSRYLRHYPNDALYSTFWNAYEEDYEKTVADRRLSESTRLEARLQLALRESDASKDYLKNLQRYRKVFPLLPWNVIGPFKNANGSAHVEVLPPEKDDFKKEARYTDESGRELQWVSPAFTAGTGRLYFEQHLQEVPYGQDFTYYAQCFFSLNQGQSLQLRVGRSAPIKIWINGYEVLSDSSRVRFQYDRDAVSLKLPAGKHSLLIKLSSYNPLMDSYDLLSFFDSPSYNQDMLSVRFTDENGAAFEDLVFSREGEVNSEWKPQSERLSLSPDEQLYQQLQLQGRPFLDFAYCKALIRDGDYYDAEAYFAPLAKKNPGNVFYSYLAAKALSFNGKIEQAYRLMSALAKEKSPVFGYLYERHQEIDLKTDPEKFKESLDFLNGLCPDSKTLVRNYLTYFDKVGKKDERDAYIQSIMHRYPEYNSWLEMELSTYVPPREKFGAREELREQKAAVKRLKRGSSDDDFETAIDFYKGRKKSNRALALMDDRIRMSPQVSSYRIEKADFLYELERYDEAIATAAEVLTINPYNETAFVTMAQCHEMKKNNNKALEMYRKALTYSSGYNRTNIRNSIEKIEGASRYKSIFRTPGFDDILQERKQWSGLSNEQDAIILLSTKDMVLTNEKQVEIYHKLMVLVLTEAGAERWTEGNFRHMGNILSLKVVKPDGSENSPDSRGGYVVFKNLSPGDLIQIETKSEFELNGPFDNEINNGYYVFYTDPVYFSKFEVAIPANKVLQYSSHKFEGGPDTFSNTQYLHYRWQHYHLPGIKDEEGVPDAFDRYRSIQVSSMTDWSKMVKWYQRETYRRLELTYDIRHVLDTLLKPTMTDEQKVGRIYNFVTRQIKYSFVPFLNSKFIPKYPANTLSAGIGDCKDVATLMIQMLREAGISAWYTLVKTNNYHYLDAVPSLAFDHVIVCYELQGKRHYADLTTNFYPLGVLPEMDNGALALLIKDGEKETFRLPADLLDANKTMVKVQIEAKLNADRSLYAEVEMEETGAAAGRSREMVTRSPTARLLNLMVEQIGSDVYENIELDQLKFNALFEIDSPLTTSFSLSSQAYADKVSGLYILRFPYVRSIGRHPGIMSGERQNRIDLNQLLDIRPVYQVLDLQFPEGYELMELPENMAASSEFGQYVVNFEARPNGIRVIKHQSFKRQLIGIDEFDDFRNFYLKLLDYDKLKIAINRKSGQN